MVATVAPPWAPEKKTTGSTGRMHGEIPVIRPPTKPTSASVTMFTIRNCGGPGWLVEAAGWPGRIGVGRGTMME
ncbi:hypothetical protein I551_3291 [Mycobacterium ulcerans str. Harvey]|uniref:Uncharacterized protein n=1 Tax=Mycobacterium ulcerans str. Harvey TaxID=1299332 RepID=A0ABP3AG67_MYCUL|nr:hypothetical protein I551_3291 [Mycobacterium ulcerans str. Harvey]